MKQLTIFCSSDEEDRVIAALDAAGVEGFMRIGGATGNTFLEPGQLPRTVSWDAVLFLVASVRDERARAVAEELKRYAGNCAIEPCLRVTLSTLDEVG
jgi:hypothetical protein